MLITRDMLDRIARGEVDLAFRRWKKPTVRAGGTLRTAIGMLEITAVERVPVRSITASDAHRAGFPTRTALVGQLRGRTGDTYRIGLRPGGADPLIDLRNQDELTNADVAAIRSRLEAMDARSSAGPWTHTYLRLLDERPHVRAEDLATSLGTDKPAFKANVRKLKALGLTISHSPGYELSPRGRAYLTASDR